MIVDETAAGAFFGLTSMLKEMPHQTNALRSSHVARICARVAYS